MRICIDSSVLIPALQESDLEAVRLLNLIGPDLVLLIPRLIAQEVTRNLRTPEQVRDFFHLFQQYDFAFIIDEPVPRDLVELYGQRGLPEKADAYIGAFTEWMKARYLISDNRHFLRDLTESSFIVVKPADFLLKWEADTLD